MYRLFVFTLLTAAVLAQAPPTQQTSVSSVPLGTVDGRVINEQTGEGIGGASVRLVPMVARPGVGNGVEHTTSTQLDGSFRFENVMPGSYVLLANQDGFVSNGTSFGRPTAISVAEGQQVSGVSLQLTPAAIVTGRVLDGDGKPVAGATVGAFTMRYFRGRPQMRQAGGTHADETGQYSLAHLGPGTYYLVAGPSLMRDGRFGAGRRAPAQAPATKANGTQPEFVRTFYPRALTLDDATPVQITAGQNLSGINITLVRSTSYHIRGRIAGFSDLARRRTSVTLSLKNGINVPGLSQTVRPDQTGNFDLAGVLPGSYTLWLRGTYISSVPNPMVAERPQILSRLDVDVGHSDVDGIELAVLPPITLSGRVQFEGSGNEVGGFSSLRVTLIVLEDLPRGTGIQSVVVSPEGTFSFRNLEPAHYALTAVNPPVGTYVKSISFNKQDVTHTGLDLTQGESGQVEIVLRPGAGEVDGTVEMTQNTAATPATIILIPETLAADGSGLLFGGARPGDHFAIHNVPPGHYYALAVERYDPAAWGNLDFIRQMQSEATAIEVEENAHAQVQLSVISTEELHQIAARLGMSL
jgi:hypothetical protein